MNGILLVLKNRPAFHFVKIRTQKIRKADTFFRQQSFLYVQTNKKEKGSQKQTFLKSSFSFHLFRKLIPTNVLPHCAVIRSF